MKRVRITTNLIVLAILVNLTTSIYFGVSSKPFCFQIEQQPGKTIKFSYQVTGQSPEQMQLQIVPHDPSRRITLNGQQGKTQFSGDYENNVCFTSTDGKYKSVSVDFYTSDKAHLMELAKKSEIYQLHTKLIEVGQNLKQIGRNEQFEQQRQIIHSQIIVSHQNTIKYFAVAKLLVIIVVALGQLYLLKSMLDKSGRGYQPV